MDRFYLLKQNRVPIIIVSLVLIVSLTALFLLYLFMGERPTTGISIRNYDQYVKNLPPAERSTMESLLYTTITSNTDQQNVGDALIRDNSYSQVEEKGNYKTLFIVDIASLQQSYKVQNIYPIDGRVDGVAYDYDTLVLCPSKEKLIYEDFNCQDRISEEKNLPQSDPILALLPHSTLDYLIEAGQFKDDKLHLQITLYLSEADYKSNVNRVIETRKQAIATWMENSGIDPNNYHITYIY